MYVQTRWRQLILASEQLETGSVAVNTGFVAIAEAPFGGIKAKWIRTRRRFYGNKRLSKC